MCRYVKRVVDEQTTRLQLSLQVTRHNETNSIDMGISSRVLLNEDDRLLNSLHIASELINIFGKRYAYQTPCPMLYFC